MEFGQLLSSFVATPLPAMLVVSLFAVVYLFKALQAANTAHLATAMQVAPLASKLVTCVEVLERLTTAQLTARGGS